MSQLIDEFISRFILRTWQVNTKLNKYEEHKYSDVLLYASMETLCNFIKNRKIYKKIKVDDELYNNINELYEWWLKYPIKKQEIEQTLELWKQSRGEPVPNIEDCSEGCCEIHWSKQDSTEQIALAERLANMENELFCEEQAAMFKLVKIRPYLAM